MDVARVNDCQKADVMNLLPSADALLLPRLHSVVERLPAGVLLLNHQGVVEYCNQSAKTLLGEPLLTQTWLAIMQRTIVPRHCGEDAINLVSGRVVRVATQSLTDQPGQIILLHDITETQQLQQRLHQYQRLSTLGRMAASLAHQIRTPVATALLYAKNLQSSALTAENQAKFSQKIVDRLEHIEAQVRDMLLFVRGGEEKLALVSLQDIAEEVQALAEGPFSQSQARLLVDNQAAGYRMYCNKDTLCGAIQNCLNNALEAVQGTGDIALVMQPLDQRHCVIKVIDQGPGMSQELQNKALEAFYTTRANGTGLGLAVAKLVTETHGGLFQLQSVQGEGTTVSFILPCLGEQ